MEFWVFSLSFARSFEIYSCDFTIFLVIWWRQHPQFKELWYFRSKLFGFEQPPLGLNRKWEKIFSGPKKWPTIGLKPLCVHFFVQWHNIPWPSIGRWLSMGYIFKIHWNVKIPWEVCLMTKKLLAEAQRLQSLWNKLSVLGRLNKYQTLSPPMSAAKATWSELLTIW